MQITWEVLLIDNSTFISVKFKRLQVYCGRHHLSLCIILALERHLGLRQRLQCLHKFLSVKRVIPLHHLVRQIETDFGHIAAVLGRFAPIAVRDLHKGCSSRNNRGARIR